jgi:hypothetical protein
MASRTPSSGSASDRATASVARKPAPSPASASTITAARGIRWSLGTVASRTKASSGTLDPAAQASISRIRTPRVAGRGGGSPASASANSWVNDRSISRKPRVQVTTPPSTMPLTSFMTDRAEAPPRVGATAAYSAAPTIQNSRGRRADCHGSFSTSARSSSVGSRPSTTQAIEREKPM